MNNNNNLSSQWQYLIRIWSNKCQLSFCVLCFLCPEMLMWRYIPPYSMSSYYFWYVTNLQRFHWCLQQRILNYFQARCQTIALLGTVMTFRSQVMQHKMFDALITNTFHLKNEQKLILWQISIVNECDGL